MAVRVIINTVPTPVSLSPCVCFHSTLTAAQQQALRTNFKHCLWLEAHLIVLCAAALERVIFVWGLLVLH